MNDFLLFLIFVAAVLAAIYFVSPESSLAKKIGAFLAVALPAFYDKIADLREFISGLF